MSVPPFEAASSTTIPRTEGEANGVEDRAGRERPPTSVELLDNSHLYRFGFKGPRAAEWLHQHGIAVPAMPNTWIALTGEGPALVARLGHTEFFIEYAQAEPAIKQLIEELATPLDGVYPVLREDRALVLRGDDLHDVLAQVCNVDFKSVSRAGRPVVMTMMAGIAVLVIPKNEKWGQSPSSDQQRLGTVPTCRIWCDPSFGDYLWSTLQDVVRGA